MLKENENKFCEGKIYKPFRNLQVCEQADGRMWFGWYCVLGFPKLFLAKLLSELSGNNGNKKGEPVLSVKANCFWKSETKVQE